MRDYELSTKIWFKRKVPGWKKGHQEVKWSKRELSNCGGLISHFFGVALKWRLAGFKSGEGVLAEAIKGLKKSAV